MAIAFVSVGSGASSAASATQALSAIALASGNAQIAAGKWETAGNMTAPTDTAGNTFSLTTQQAYAGGAAFVCGAYVVNCAPHATNVVTLNFSSASADWHQGAVGQYSGVATSSPLDQQTVSSGTVSPASSSNITTTNANDVAVGWFGTFTGTTFSSEQIAGSASNIRYTGSDFEFIDRIVSATFTGAATCTILPSGSWGAAIVTLKEAGGGGGFTPVFRRTLSGLGSKVGSRQLHGW